MYSGPPMSAAPMYSGPPMSAAPMYSGPPPGSYTEVQRTVVPTTRMARRQMVVTPPPRTMAVAVPGYQIVDQPPMMTPLPMPVEMPPMEVIEMEYTHDMVPFQKRTGKSLFSEFASGNVCTLGQKHGRTLWSRFWNPIEKEHKDFTKTGVVPVPKSKMKEAEKWLDENDPKRLAAIRAEQEAEAKRVQDEEDERRIAYQKKYDEWWSKNWGTPEEQARVEQGATKPEGFY
eukprot:Tamp_14657.p1 GENE.Tamp_14657~~Tamp_14657.p1  ORF type:complete len:230 (+),score=43.10 Tamp_14657:248-937(+)